MAIEDKDHAFAAAVQGDSDTPVTVAELADAAGVELVTGEEDEGTDTDEATSRSVARRRARTTGTTTSKSPEDETA